MPLSGSLFLFLLLPSSATRRKTEEAVSSPGSPTGVSCSSFSATSVVDIPTWQVLT